MEKSPTLHAHTHTPPPPPPTLAYIFYSTVHTLFAAANTTNTTTSPYTLQAPYLPTPTNNTPLLPPTFIFYTLLILFYSLLKVIIPVLLSIVYLVQFIFRV